MMKRIVLAVAAALSLASISIVAANAADVARPRYAAPSYNVASTFNWTGFYAGGTVGYGKGSAGSSNIDTGGFTAPMQADSGVRGSILGATLGYNYQLGQFVIGLEADYSMANIKGSGSSDAVAFGFIPVNASVNSRIDSIGTVRGRVGYSFGEGNRYLAYGTYGYAYGTGSVNGNSSIFGSPLYTFSDSGSLKGWALGGGIEAKISKSWSAKAEYLRVDLGSMSTDMQTFAGPVAVSTRFKTDIFRVGLNYQF